jgi:hypothetical protein
VPKRPKRGSSLDDEGLNSSEEQAKAAVVMRHSTMKERQARLQRLSAIDNDVSADEGEAQQGEEENRNVGRFKSERKRDGDKRLKTQKESIDVPPISSNNDGKCDVEMRSAFQMWHPLAHEIPTVTVSLKVLGLFRIFAPFYFPFHLYKRGRNHSKENTLKKKTPQKIP